MEQGITLSELKKAWSNLSPIRNIDNLGDKKILVYLAKKDKIMPYDQGIKLLEKLKESKYDYRVIVNKHSGHYLGSFVNMLRFWVYLKFSKEN